MKKEKMSSIQAAWEESVLGQRLKLITTSEQGLKVLERLRFKDVIRSNDAFYDEYYLYVEKDNVTYEMLWDYTEWENEEMSWYIQPYKMRINETQDNEFCSFGEMFQLDETLANRILQRFERKLLTILEIH